MEGLAGVTAIDWSAAAVTVSVVAPLMPESAALIDEVPTAAAVASPLVPAAFDIVATLVVADAQLTWLVRFWVEASENVPVAVNCWVSPLATEGLPGVTAIDCKTGSVTVITVEPVTEPNVALILEVPLATAVASPFEPAASEIVATE